MLRRLLAEFVRWLANKWASGQIDKVRKKEEWDEQKDSFKDAASRWRSRDAEDR